MVIRPRIRAFLTALGLYAVAALFIGYFGVNAYTGKNGINARQELDLARQVGDLLVKLLARIDAIFPRVGVDAEITDEQRRYDVEAERRKKGTNPRTNNHRAFVLPMRLKRS